MVNILIAEQFQQVVDSGALEKAAQAVLSEQNLKEEVNLSIVIEDDKQLHTLNLEFLGIDAPTTCFLSLKMSSIPKQASATWGM